MASPNTERLRAPRMVRVHRLEKVGARCKTSDGSVYERTQSGAIIQVDKDRRSVKERKRARREAKCK